MSNRIELAPGTGTLTSPAFGLPVPNAARYGWGARAILNPRDTQRPLDFLHDRQEALWFNAPTLADKARFIAWINGSTEFLARAFTDPTIFDLHRRGGNSNDALIAANRILTTTTEPRRSVGFTSSNDGARFHLRATNHSSPGYCYIACWQEDETKNTAEIWDAWFLSAYKSDKPHLQTSNWLVFITTPAYTFPS